MDEIMSIDNRRKQTRRGRTAGRLALCALALFAALAWPALSSAATYYVSTSGNDGNDGLAPAFSGGTRGPFRSLMRAALYVRPGDSVLIRGGTYAEISSWTTDGTQAAPITITNYNGETVEITGNNHTIPSGTYGTLVSIKGDWYNVSNLSIGYSSWYGMAVDGYHCVVENIFAHHNWSSGIYTAGWYNLILNCRAYNNSLINAYFRPHDGTWGFGISACRYPQYTTIRGCTAWANWGEGISTFESYHITIEDCVSYNNQQNFYLSDTRYAVLQRCLSYYTPGNPIQAYDTQCAILMGNEGHTPACADNTIINNLCWGGERNVAIGSNTFVNGLVAHNTFVNASPTAGSESACVYIFGGTYSSARFQNNIAVQDDSVPIARVGASGVRFVSNLWSKTPVSSAVGSGDIVGLPLLKGTGIPEAGSLSPAWFDLTEASPARDHATPLAAVPEDFRRNPRGSAPDMGAFEFTGSGTDTDTITPPVVTTILNANVVAMPTTGRAPFPVTFAAVVAGGTPPYTYRWTFGDGGTSTEPNPTHTYELGGIFRASLTVTDAKATVTSSSSTITVRTKVDIKQLRHDRRAAPRIILK
ncbi:MAG TPA: PKD domain-containing protein [Candidatus Bathyarchaeia archaeon]|nr:PKD domain-containing protein [Candidatus Bathyarchaeia archaeon]